MEHEMDQDDLTGFETISISRVSWGAILAGTVVVLAVQLLLNVLGIGIGASTIEPLQQNDPLAGMGWAGAIWLLASTLIALFIGGWVAARLAGTVHRLDSILHGFVTWGLATVLMAYLITSAAGSMLSGAAGMMGQGIMALGQSAGSMSPELAGILDQMPGENQMASLRQEALEALSGPGEGQQAANQTRIIVDRFFRDQGVPSASDREAMINALMQQSRMDRSQAAATVNDWEQAMEETRAGGGADARAQMKRQGREAASAAASGMARFAIWLFVAMILGAMAAAIGGAIGTVSEREILP